MKIVSACLAGVHCRYNGESKEVEKVKKLIEEGEAIPVCPEQLGGLPTPREPAEQQEDGRILTKSGADVTEEFFSGAIEATRIAKSCGAKEAILKSKSPSCGCGKIPDGSFNSTLKEGEGVFCQLLKENGLDVKTEEDE